CQNLIRQELYHSNRKVNILTFQTFSITGFKDREESSMLLIVLTFAIMAATAAENRRCSVCSTNGKACKQDYKDMKQNCDYCLQISGTITGNTPDAIKFYLKSKPEHKTLSLAKGKKVFARDCITKSQIQAFGFTPRVDCSNFNNDEGFTGTACTCAGDC
uniref:Sodefrin-like factor n=1 Tax=Romanomermis culicivorax TaxID=13658 RepID=A0A915L7T9_ROMCU